MNDPRLDRRIQFDPRSRNFQVRALLAPLPRRGRFWRPGPTLDQGREGACIGFAAAHKASGYRIKATGINSSIARSLYKRAQYLDEWPGEDYEGTSVLAGMKAGVEQGYWNSYRWIGAGSGMPIDDVVDTLGWIGGIIFGLSWFDSMYEPRPSGLLEVDTTGLAGGHAIYAPALRLKARLPGEGYKPKEVVVLQNSWGTSYGVPAYGQAGGFVFIELSDLERLLELQGEGAVPNGVSAVRP